MSQPSYTQFRDLARQLLESAGAAADLSSLTSIEKHNERRPFRTADDYTTGRGRSTTEITPREWAWLAAYYYLAEGERKFYLSGISLKEGKCIWPDKDVMASFLLDGKVEAREGKFVLSEDARNEVLSRLATCGVS